MIARLDPDGPIPFPVVAPDPPAEPLPVVCIILIRADGSFEMYRLDRGQSPGGRSVDQFEAAALILPAGCRWPDRRSSSARPSGTTWRPWPTRPVR